MLKMKTKVDGLVRKTFIIQFEKKPDTVNIN